MRTEILRHEPRKPVTGIWDTTYLEAMLKVGERMGIGVFVLAKEGESYLTKSGHLSKVEEGKSYVQVGDAALTDLGAFWRAVEQEKASQISE